MTFKPGQSGNPGGRKKEKPFRDALMLAIQEADNDKKKLRLVAEKLVDKAAGGDVAAIKEIADRLDGKVPQGVIGGDEDDPPVRTVNKIELVALGDGSSSSTP